MRVFECEIDVDYHLLYVGSLPLPERPIRPIAGIAVPYDGGIYATTSVVAGPVSVRVEVHDSEPAFDESGSAAIELSATFGPKSAVRSFDSLVPVSFGDVSRDDDDLQGWHRVRVVAERDFADYDIVSENSRESWSFQLWPAQPSEPLVLRRDPVSAHLDEGYS